MPRKITDEFLTKIASQYTEFVDAGQRPAPAIAESEGAPVATVHRWINEARKCGLLAPTTPGLATGSSQRKPLGNAGNNVRRNVRALRQARRMTYVELSQKLTTAGSPIPVLGLRRIENGTRRVDADDLVALAATFGIAPALLLEEPTGCGTCQGAPPPGFACNECGTGSATP
jgi:hypothetical protein